MKSTIEIILLSRCNFSCDYCIAGSNRKENWINVEGKKVFIDNPDEILADSSGFPVIVKVDDTTPNEVYEDVFRKGKLTNNQALDPRRLMYYASKNLKGWDIVLSGGEPLMYPGVDKIIESFTQHSDVILLTNASLIQKFPHLLKNPRVFFRVGFHPEYRKMDEFFENMTFISERTDNYVVNYVHHPRHRKNDRDKGFVDMLKEFGFRYEVTPFKGEWKGKNYDYDVGLFDPSFLTETYVESVPEDEKLVPGISFMSMYADGEVWSCHRKKTMTGVMQTGLFQPYESIKGLDCISKGNCGCDSMRAYRSIGKIKES